MTIKKIIPTACFVLGVFICGCQDNTLVSPADPIKQSPVGTTQTHEENGLIDATKPSEKNRPTVIAYYFHRTMRCPTCLAIEANVARVIEENFPQQIANGGLIWIPFNLDDPGGKDFEKEFDVSVSTLVLSKMEDSNNSKYKKLEKVWDLIGVPVKFDE
ncbi:MAG: nitrophenyl compound nitroreductase subunit ArsF family protein, partial [Planctomycetota bacterium]